MCPPMWALWRHLANTIELVLPSANPIPQPKRQIDRFSRSGTAHGRKSLYGSAAFAQMTAECPYRAYFTMGRPFPPQNCPIPWGYSEPLSNTWFPGPTQVVNPNGISIGSAVFAVAIVHSTMHTHMNKPNSSLDLVLSHWAHFTVLRFIFVYVCIFCMTDHDTRSVTTDRIYAAIHSTGDAV